jgi:hypothetical protein
MSLSFTEVPVEISPKDGSLDLVCPVCPLDDYGCSPMQGVLISRREGGILQIVWTCNHRRFGALHTGFLQIPADNNLENAKNFLINTQDLDSLGALTKHQGPPPPTSI